LPHLIDEATVGTIHQFFLEILQNSPLPHSPRIGEEAMIDPSQPKELGTLPVKIVQVIFDTVA
jgi:hypothetical protein